MIGITNIAAYVPRFRLERGEIVRQWEQKAMEQFMVGSRSVANYDEDSLTMSVEAGLKAIATTALDKIDAVYCASTSFPYAEKSNAVLLAKVLGLSGLVDSFDFASSLRSGANALIAALNGLKAGLYKKTLLTVADIRTPKPGSMMEHALGDGGAALLLGTENPVATIEGWSSVNDEYTGVWKTEGDRFLSVGDEKYTNTESYFKTTLQSIDLLLKKTGLQPAQIKKVVCYAPDGPSYMALAKKSPLAKAFNQEPLLMTVGNAGSAGPFLQLQVVLEEAAPGDFILFNCFGNGATCFLLKVTDAIKAFQGNNPKQAWLKDDISMSSYGKYLQYRGILETEMYTNSKEIFTSQTMLNRDQEQGLRLIGKRCQACEHLYFPPGPICPNCNTSGKSSPQELLRKGNIATFTKDHLNPSPNLPVPMVVVDLNGGGRFCCQFTDYQHGSSLAIGDKVELVFRRLHCGNGMINYHWKARKAL